MTWAGLWILISCDGGTPEPEQPTAPVAEPPAAPPEPPAAPPEPPASCPLPAPSDAVQHHEPDFAPYLAQLQQADIHAELNADAASSDGHVSSSPVLSIHTTATIHTCWPVFRTLLGIPEGLDIPAEGPAEQVIDNPSKPEWLWEDNITVSRDATSRVQTVHYYMRAEGGGSGAWVRVAEGRIQVSVDGIVD